MKNILITNVKSITCPFSFANSGGRRVKRANHALIFKFEGETIYESNRKTMISNAEKIAFLPKGCDYIWKSKIGGHFYSIEFEGELDEAEMKLFKYPYKDKLSKIFSDFEFESLKNSELKKFLMVQCAYRVLYELLIFEANHTFLPTSKKNDIQKIIEYINKNIASALSNETLSEKFGYSVSYFRAVFYKVMGVSPMQYVNRIRMEKAVEMLDSDYGTITDLAESLGYQNVYHFSNAFKKYYGLSPLRYKHEFLR
ncbi:MAG TPA: hypothetical protein DCZ41_01365 [Firmicutes bacterium]|nr:hypothetical protein [Bacillota bacterium]